MIGSGGKIGGPPPEVARTPAQEPTTTAKPAAERAATPTTKDQFERSAGTGRAAPQSIERESTNTATLLRMARENPQGARDLVSRFAQQATGALSDAQREMAAARAVLEQLAGERFSKKACDAKRKELRAQREKLAAIKLRHQLAARKMALLQQLAGKLGDPRLADELDRILGRHQKLKSGWGRRHHLLSLGESLYGDLPETPEHLKKVIRTEVRPGAGAEKVGAELEELSPRRVFSEMMARTLDGTPGRISPPDAAAGRGELGRALQVYSRFVDGVAADGETDPFEDEG